MKKESILPDVFEDEFKTYLSLQSDQEKARFWNELTDKFSNISPEILRQKLLDGIIAISSRVDSLAQQIKAGQPV